MDKRLTRNYSDPDSRRWWEAAEKAGANPPKIVVPSLNNDLKAEAQSKTDLNKSDPELRNANDQSKTETAARAVSRSGVSVVTRTEA